MKRFALACVIVLALFAPARAQAPNVTQIEPITLVPGKPVDVTFVGGNLAGTIGVWTSAPATVELTPGIENNGKQNERVTYRITLAADAPRGLVGMRIAGLGGVSNLRLLAVDDLPTVPDKGSNNLESAVVLQLPAAVDGHIDGESGRFFKFTAASRQRISFDVLARRLGSPLDAALHVLDTSGREVAYLDDTETTGSDPRGSITLPVAGDYFVELRDVRYKGGVDYAYHLRIGDFDLPPLPYPLLAPVPGNTSPETAEQEPNNTLEAPNVAILPGAVNGRFDALGDRDFFQFEGKQGQRLRFVGQTRSFGSAADLLMRLYKADGGQIAEAEDSGAEEGVLDITLPADGIYKLCVEELNRRSGPDFVYRINVQPYSPGFALVVENDKYDTAQGAPLKIKVTVRRRDYNGPVTLSVEGIDGLTVADNVLAEGAGETQLTVTPPAACAPGSIKHLRIIGAAKIGETEVRVPASTQDALKKTLNGLPYPPDVLDGLVALGISSPKPEEKK